MAEREKPVVSIIIFHFFRFFLISAVIYGEVERRIMLVFVWNGMDADACLVSWFLHSWYLWKFLGKLLERFWKVLAALDSLEKDIKLATVDAFREKRKCGLVRKVDEEEAQWMPNYFLLIIFFLQQFGEVCELRSITHSPPLPTLSAHSHHKPFLKIFQI